MKKQGFTLIELLVAIMILMILALVGIMGSQSALVRSRDTKRKNDLKQIQNALELYYNDYRKYPESSSGKIKVPGLTAFTWGTSTFRDSKSTVYMKILPAGPLRYEVYCYSADANLTWYKLYAGLENTEDPAYSSYACNGKSYTYGVSSANTTP